VEGEGAGALRTQSHRKECKSGAHAPSSGVIRIAIVVISRAPNLKN